jgi:hypothetical protein
MRRGISSKGRNMKIKEKVTVTKDYTVEHCNNRYSVKKKEDEDFRFTSAFIKITGT